jgi:hypothetical protein
VDLEEAGRWLPPERLALREVVAARRALATLEAQLVCCARRGGASWTQLAQDLQLTRQGARQRHLKIDPVATRPRRRRPSFLDGGLERGRSPH